MLKTIYKTGEMELFQRYRAQNMAAHPLTELFWECTLACNAHCKHCGSNAGTRPVPNELSTKEAKAAFYQIAQDFDAKRIMLNVTGGEPLLRADLFDVMEYATALGFPWGMTTNGMLLDSDAIQGLRRAGMQTVSISIDGLAATHDAFRGVPGSYNRILRNIHALKDAGFVQHIQVTTVFHKQNLAQLDALYAAMRALPLDSWRLVSMDPIGRAGSHSDLLLDGDELRTLLEFILRHKKDKGLDLQYGCPGYLGLQYEKEVRRQFFHCRTGVNVGSILANGDLFVCPNVPRLPHLIQGNIRQDRFSTVWNTGYAPFRTPQRTYCTHCDACEHWRQCLGGAFHTWNFDENRQNKCPLEMMRAKV